MSVNGSNHIIAPVSTDDVASVLGVNSHDVGTLCISDRINPYSLIQPVYCTSPDIETAWLKEHNEYPMPESGDGWNYTAKNWGYYVPYVNAPNQIKTITEKPWVRGKPDNTSFKNLAHFDGYRHNVEPRMPVSVSAIPGENIVIFLFWGEPQSDIISQTGKQNNGGVVSIREVLGNVRIGCTLYRENTTLGSYINSAVISNDNANGFVQIETTHKATPNTEYQVVPWVTDGNVVNGQVVSGSKFFSLKYAEMIDSYIIVQTPNTTVAIGRVEMVQQTGLFTFYTKIINQYNEPQAVSNFRLVARYNYQGNVKNKTIWLPVDPVGPYPANSDTDIELYTSDAELTAYGTKLLNLYIIAQWKGETLQSPTIPIESSLDPVMPM